MSRGEGRRSPHLQDLVLIKALTKIFEKTFQKPLDKTTKVWYNNSTVRESPTEYKKFLREVLTMANKKMTKKEMFNLILSHTTDPKEKEFLLHEIELLDKKTESKGMSEAQKENEKIKQSILDRLGEEEGCKMTISAMIKCVPACNGMSTSKVSSLVRQLKVDGLVVREEIKGVAYFSLA
jgi:hypothetical protein